LTGEKGADLLQSRVIWKTEPFGVVPSAVGQSIAIEVVMEGGLCVIEVDGVSINFPESHIDDLMGGSESWRAPCLVGAEAAAWVDRCTQFEDKVEFIDGRGGDV
jgi:hypothetical protein